ncbi:unnamed protein product [Peronospora destructor]|uniref:Spc7 kinetochore protein domain-containing protein n=1 Tax=Peronospora destructor TaxID=86335 RepID=A0AAV0T1E4_9STRA|nr:unnamed protein product [Peronospora destructor]
MADADDIDTAYALRTSTIRQQEIIKYQLQRDILGEIAVDKAQDEALNASLVTAAMESDAASSSAIENQVLSTKDTEKKKEHQTEEDEPLSSEEERRCTLSPSKARLLEEEILDKAVARRDTVSPETLKVVLRAAGEEGDEGQQVTEKKSPLKSRNSVELQHLTERKEKEEEECKRDIDGDSVKRWRNLSVQDSPVRLTRSKSKQPRSVTKKKILASDQSVEDRRKSTSMVDTSDSFTDLMFAPNLLEQDTERRTTLDPTEAAAVVSALKKEMRCLNNTALEMESELDDDDRSLEQRRVSKVKTVTPSKLTKDKKVSPPLKENNNLPKKVRRSKPSNLSNDSTRKKSPSPVAKSRTLPSPAKEAKSKESLNPTKDNSIRRMTVDPGDALVMLEDISQLKEKDNRRQTIDEHGLLELTSAQESPLAVDKNSAKESSRKRAKDLDACGDVSEKRVRPSNDDPTMESMDLDSPVHMGSKLGPQAKDQQETSNRNQRSSDKLPASNISKPSLFSPPPKIRTSLKGILSARKLRNNAADPVQTTPNKSVNFGPSQGAEFNHGSPSTSMTPMLAKDALRLFPLESPASSEEEFDDAETSLNTSILDEADSVDEKKPTIVGVLTTTQLKKPGFDLLQSRRSSFLGPKTAEKRRRRQSMRGYSPLDSQTEARRRRRQTINVTRQTPTVVSAMATSFTLDESSSASSLSPSNNSFSRATNVFETGRMPYADSSASSDVGEDMEITGDYTHMLGRDSDATRKQSVLSASQSRDEDTAEFSLGHLLAESSVYELTKSVQESDHQDLPESLGDLANEVASQDSLADGAFLRLNDQDAPLDPIQEKDETMTSSRGQSMMSLDLNESDEENTANFESLQVNLKAKFDRVSTDGEANFQRQASPETLPVHLITMEELLASIALNEQNAQVGMDDAFFEEKAESSDNQILKDVKLACAYDTCSKVVERHARDVSSWSIAVTEELSSLLSIKAPAVFSPGILDNAGREAIQELYATEAMVARTGWYQLQAQVENQLTSSLSVGADMLANDVRSLKDCVSAGMLKRQNELAAIKEMIDREEQMALLLDAIEEQQGAHDEYATAVKDLEKECSSLSLEESVLRSRLNVLEGRAAELEPVTSEAASLFEQEVLATEEMLAIQESMSVWKICEATASALRLSARFEDVLFDVEICVDVHVGSFLMGETSASIKTNELLKHKERSMYLSYESDVVLVLQRLLLDPHYISQIADESDFGDKDYGHMLSKLQILEHFINRSFRLLKELRELSTRFAMRYNEEDSALWVDFLKLPSAVSRLDAECVQFSVGFSLLPVYPYTDYQTAVQVPHGQVSCDAIVKEIELVSRQEPKYFTRVCRQLHESFAR